MHHYTTKGTCSRSIDIELDGDIIKTVTFADGCDGNLAGISNLIAGMNIYDVIPKTKGILCRNGTSCPDQLATALEGILRERESNAGN